MATAEEAARITKFELSALNDMYTRMMNQCYHKCIHTARTSDLEVGEMACIDRCVPKYLETHQKVQAQFQKFQETQAMFATEQAKTGQAPQA